MRLLLAFFLAASASAQTVNPAPRLTPEQAADLETKLEKTPDDEVYRELLLIYYQSPAVEASAGKEARRRHILWLIEHHPESSILSLPYSVIASQGRLADPEGASAAEKLWRQVGEKDDAPPLAIARAA